MKDMANPVLKQRVFAIDEDKPEQKGKLTTYRQVGNYLLASYATDIVSADGKADVRNLKQPGEMSAVRYSEVLWGKSPRYCHANYESRLG